MSLTPPSFQHVPTDGQARIYALAFDEGIRVLEAQERSLEQLRVRMIAILGTATTVTAVLLSIISKAPGKERDGAFIAGMAVGAVLFAALVTRCFQALRPKREWRFNLSPKTIIDGYADHEQPASLAETHRELGMILQRNIDHNQINLYWLQKLLHQALVLLIVELASWACLAAKVA